MAIYELNGKKPVIAPDAFIHPEAVVIGEAIIGKGCFIGPGAVIRADFGPIAIGDGSTIQDNAVLHVSPGDRVLIEDRVIIAHGVLLHDAHIQPLCMIGMGAVILQKVVCGRGCLIAAGAVVPHGMPIPAGKMATGNPARIVKNVPPDFEAHVLAGLEHYRTITERYRESMKKI